MIVKPFGGLEANTSEVERISCPPYDVVSLEEAKAFAKDPHSFMRVVRSDAIVRNGEDVYEIASKELKRFVDDGLLLKNKKPAFYIYSQMMGNHSQTGIIACVSSKEYPEKIKRHELTRKEKEDERLNHILATHAHTGQVFLMYRSQLAIKKLMNTDMAKLLYNVKTKAPETIHKIYKIEDERLMDEIVSAFSELNAFYIADGHHRAAASVRAAKKIGGEGEWNYFMATIFPHDELQIMGNHRIVKTLGKIGVEKFLINVKSAGFDVKCTYNEVPEISLHVMGMYLDGKWYKIKAKDVDNSDLIERLDVQILQRRILEPVFDIKDPRTNPDLTFIGGTYGAMDLKKAVDSGEGKVAFLMYPTQVEDVINVADANLIMPPKSTWFEPKLRSGFVVHDF